MDLSFRHIRYFVAAAEAGSVTGAAALVGVSQSAVTEAIKSIEHQLGVPLLQRHPRGVSLTHEGHQFLRHAHAMIEALTAAGRTLSAAGRKLTGRLGLGVSPMVAGYFLADLLARFRRTFPGVEVAPSEDRRPFIEQLLINGEPVLSAINSASYAVHHSSGRLAAVGPHTSGEMSCSKWPAAWWARR